MDLQSSSLPHPLRQHATRIALLDDHETSLDALVLQLREHGGVTIAGAWTHSSQLMQALACEVIDVVLLDFSLAADDLACCTLIGMIHGVQPQTRVLVLSASSSALVIASALRAGAAGFVCKTADLSTLLRAIGQVAAGGEYLAEDSAPLRALTSREREVLLHILAGGAVSAVPHSEGPRGRTISTHKPSPYRRLGLHGDADLCRLAPMVLAMIDGGPPA